MFSSRAKIEYSDLWELQSLVIYEHFCMMETMLHENTQLQEIHLQILSTHMSLVPTSSKHRLTNTYQSC